MSITVGRIRLFTRYHRIKHVGLTTAVVLFTTWSGTQWMNGQEELVRVPAGKPVMVDGKIERGEWSDAAEVKMRDGARLYLKSAGDFVCVAVLFPTSRSGFTDLYIASEGGNIDDLHASAKLGERRLHNGKWPDWNSWWNNDGWVANVSQVRSFEKRTFMPANAREYQIKRSRFGGHVWRLMVDLSLDSEPGEYTVVRFPESTSNSNPQTWLKVQVEP